MNLSILNNLNTNKLFTNLVISQLISSIILINFLVKPIIIRRYALGEEFSNILKEFYVNNLNDGLVIDILYSVIINFTVIRIFNLLTEILDEKFNNIFLYILISLITIYITGFIISFFLKKSNVNNENINFFKNIANKCKKESLTWHIINYLGGSLVFIFFLANNYENFNILLLFSIYFLFNKLS